MTVLDRLAPAVRDIAERQAAEPAGHLGGTPGAARARLRQVAAPVAIYLAGQAVAVGMLAFLCAARGYSLLDSLTAWDGQHFLRIATHGYTFSTAADTPGSPAFLPGYPGLIAALHTVTGVPAVAVALAISWIAGAVFACAIPQLVRRIPGMDHQAGLIAVALVAVSPVSITLAMAYSEALFCALASWALVHALRGNWWIAGLLALTAGTVRISGLALAVAFGVAAIAAATHHRGSGRAALAAAIRPAAASLAAVIGTLAWIIGSGLAMGSPTAWFTAQHTGWNSHIDFGLDTARFIYRMATTAPDLYEVVTAAVIIAAVALAVASIRQHQPTILIAYGLAALAEVLASAGVMNSKIRLLIPAFTILLPAAAWLARQPRAHARWALAVLAVAGSWLGAYALTIWTHAI